jgi:hypothetical protein
VLVSACSCVAAKLVGICFLSYLTVKTWMSEQSVMYERFVTGALRSVNQGISSRSMDED